MKKRSAPKPLTVGWREWVALPAFGLTHIKAKMDTGARTSSLHATHMHDVVRDGEVWVQFQLSPHQRSTVGSIACQARVLDERIVKSSSGHAEHRVVIETPVSIGKLTLPVEVTLTDRADMNFRMLIGRSTLRKMRLLIDSRRSFLLGEPDIDLEMLK